MGTIEVLVLRCRSNDTAVRAPSTSSSCEHSGIMDNPMSEGTGAIPEADITDKKSSTGKAAGKTEAPAATAEPEGLFGGIFGLFDGPADQPPLRRVSGDGPSDDYYDYWQSHTRPSPRYGPQEGPHRVPEYRPPPAAYDDERRQRYSYYDSSPPVAYARPPSPPPRPGKHVHFDYGDGRGPRQADYTKYYHRPHPSWGHSDRREHTRTRRGYNDEGYHGRHNLYADYSGPPDRAHYSYESGRRTYAEPREPLQSYNSYGAPSPPTHATQQAFVPPHPAGYPVHHGYGPPPFTAPHASVPNLATSVPSGPPIPSKLPMQPLHVTQAQSASYVPPVAMHPSSVPLWPYPGPYAPVYLPPAIPPPFHSQASNVNNGPTNQAGNATGKTGNDSSNTVRYDNVSDQNPPADSNNNGGRGEPGANDNAGNNFRGSEYTTGNDDNNNNHNAGWANSGGNTNNNSGWENSGGNDHAGGSNSNKNPPDTDWEQNANSNNNNTGSGNNNDDWNATNAASNNQANDWSGNDACGGNNDQGWSNDNGAGQGWDNKTGTGDTSSDQNNQNQNNGGNQQGDPGWENDNQNGQPSTWNNNHNSHPAPTNQQNNWNNGPINTAPFSNQPIAEESQENSRVLYGPYGPYYGAKSIAQKGPPPDAEEEPRYDVPQTIAQNKGVTKQVQPGPGYLYVKKRCAPEYIDSLDEPYAKFVFKYRTKEQLKNEIGVDTAGEPTGDEEVNALASMDKGDLIQMVLRAKGALGGTIPEPAPRVTPPGMNGFEPIHVPAPDLSFLYYNLPQMRNVSNNAGLGIRYSNSSGSHPGSGNVAQNGNPNGAGGWQEDNNLQNGGGTQNWQDNNNNWNKAAGKGWDGQQEHKPSNATQPRRDFSMQSQGIGQQKTNFQPQDASRLSSEISPKNVQNFPPQGPSNAPYERIFAEAQGAGSGQMPGPPPPPPINITGTGTVGGGQVRWDSAPSGAEPHLPKRTYPPPPPSPVTQNQETGEFRAWVDEGANIAAIEPKGGW